MFKKTRIIDLTSRNIANDVKVEFAERYSHYARFAKHRLAIPNPGMNLLPEVEKMEIRDPLEIGYVGFSNERICILCDTDDKSIDKLIAVENYFNYWIDWMFRIPEDEKIEISVVFTGIPYVIDKDSVLSAKTKKIAAALKWQLLMRNQMNIKYTAIGDWTAPISIEKDYNSKKVYVDTCLNDNWYDGSERPIVHVVNPMSDILYSMKVHNLIEDCDAIWISPSILSMKSYVEIEDSFIGCFIIKEYKDIDFLINHQLVGIKKGDETTEFTNMNPKHIACFATSVHDFMTFNQDIVMYASNTMSTSEPLNLSLFINYTPDAADDQKLYGVMNSFMNYIENNAPIMDVTIFMLPFDVDNGPGWVERDKLKFIPNTIELYHSKIIDALCC